MKTLPFPVEGVEDVLATDGPTIAHFAQLLTDREFDHLGIGSMDREQVMTHVAATVSVILALERQGNFPCTLVEDPHVN